MSEKKNDLNQSDDPSSDDMNSFANLGPAAFVNLLQWPALIAVVCGIVFGMRSTYCGDYDPNRNA